MINKYTMFGYDEGVNPTAVSNVTAKQAGKIAEAKDLTGYFLAPHYDHTPESGGIRSYQRDENGHYGVVSLGQWIAANHLTL